jgi:hypothetical protein
MKSLVFKVSRAVLHASRSMPLQVFTASLVLLLSAAVASAQPFVYIVGLAPNGSPQFGTIDLANGKFHRIAYTQVDNTPVSLSNLVWRNGSLLSLATSGTLAGYLVKIDPATGEITAIGSTGLGYDAFSLGEVKTKLYLTDFNTGGTSQNIYSVDPETGAATLIGATGVPADPTIPFTTNPDGTFNLCDESFYGIGGKLYATFDSFNVFPATLEVDKYPTDSTVSPALYQIDPSTGATTLIAPTNLFIGATVEVHGILYGFRGVITGFPGGFPAGFTELVTVDLANGGVTFLRINDVNTGAIFGAVDARDGKFAGK